MLGGLHPGHKGSVLHCRVRYFDPVRRRAGIPKDIAALVETMDADHVALTLVNVNQVESRTAIVQAGGYAEHQFIDVTQAGKTTEVDNSHFTVQLAPGAGRRLVIGMKRYVNQPTMMFPWERR